MGKISKVILDALPHHPLHKLWRELAEKLASELGVELEILNEDYVFAIEHGDTDDLGMSWLPQLFVKTESGEIKLVMSTFPFDPATTKPDPDAAYREALSRIEEIIKDP